MKNRTLKMWLFLLAGCLGCSAAICQHYSNDAWKKDLVALKESCEMVHPGLFRFQTKEKWDQHFDSLFNLKGGRNIHELFVDVSSSLALIKCGHTNLDLSFQNSAQFYNRLFPFTVLQIGDKIYLDKNFSRIKQLPRYLEIISINDRPIKEIIEALRPMISQDGFIQTNFYEQLSEFFPFGYFHKIGRPEQFVIQVLENGREKKITTAAIPLLELSQKRRRRHKEKNTRKFKSYIEKAENYGYLKIISFDKAAIQGKGTNYKNYLKRFFRKIDEQNIENVVIDLRGNGGGHLHISAYVYSFLTDEKFDFFTKSIWNCNFAATAMTESEKVKKPLSFTRKESGVCVQNSKEFQGIPANIHPFSGKVYFLTDGVTFSAASYLASFARMHNDKVVVVGEESGGMRSGPNGGYFIWRELPYSRLKFRLPVKWFIQDQELGQDNSGRGVIPDYEVINDLKSIRNGRDKQLEFVLELIRGE